MKKTTLSLLTITALTATINASAALVTFDENALPVNTFFDPQSNANFTSGGVSFDHSWNTEFNCCWGNFTYSNSTDITTAGFTNDRSAITGDGAGSGQDNYGISFDANAYIDFGSQTQVSSADITNTTYAYLSMLNGDSFAKQFEAGDFFRLTINGLNQSGSIITSTIFSLAEGTSIVNSWTSVDLSILGVVYGLSFNYSSSDLGSFGINTPQYFAIDNIDIQTVPVPAAAYLFISALGALIILRKKQN